MTEYFINYKKDHEWHYLAQHFTSMTEAELECLKFPKECEAKVVVQEELK